MGLVECCRETGGRAFQAFSVGQTLSGQIRHEAFLLSLRKTPPLAKEVPYGTYLLGTVCAPLLIPYRSCAYTAKGTVGTALFGRGLFND